LAELPNLENLETLQISRIILQISRLYLWVPECLPWVKNQCFLCMPPVADVARIHWSQSERRHMFTTLCYRSNKVAIAWQRQSFVCLIFHVYHYVHLHCSMCFSVL